MRKVYDILRSRRLAFWLIGLFTAYAAIATTLSDGDYGKAYASPAFALISFALMLSTGACAWERTVRAVRTWRLGTDVTPAFSQRLASDPQIEVPLPARSDPDAILAAASTRLSSRGLRVRVGNGRLAGCSRWYSLVGSPLFHWSLALLFLAVGAGRLTRAEGLVGVPLGGQREDIAESYGVLSEGPLHDSDFSGLTIAVPELDVDFVLGGVSRGESPVVELYDGETLVARRRVYPNHPLRYRSMLIHTSAYGLAARYSLHSGEATSAIEVFYDFSASEPVALEAAPLVLEAGATRLDLSTSVALDVRDGVAEWGIPSDPVVTWTLDSGSATTGGLVRPGESIDLGGSGTLVLESVTYYSRLSVVDDPSVYPIYVLFVTGVVGLALALLLPPRAAWVMVVDTDGAGALHARTRQGRGDRVFPGDVEDLLVDVAGKDVT